VILVSAQPRCALFDLGGQYENLCALRDEENNIISPQSTQRTRSFLFIKAKKHKSFCACGLRFVVSSPWDQDKRMNEKEAEVAKIAP
jgi:hypothetical protein